MEDDDLKTEYEKLKKMDTRVENYLDIFYEKYNLVQKLRNEQFPLLNEMARDFLEKKYRLTDVYKFLVNKKSEIEAKILPTLTEEQKELFELWDFIEGETMLDMQEQGFIYGFIARSTAKRRSKENSLIN